MPTRDDRTSCLRTIARAWNWKSALFSAMARAALFFAANLSAGLHPAIAAAQTEFLYRAVAAGFYGSLTEYFSSMRASRGTTLAAVVVVPAVAHAVEFLVHRASGTPKLGTAVLVSIAFSLVTTRFNLFAMRRGLLLGGRSLAVDIRALAALGRASVASGRRAARTWSRARFSN